MFAETETEAEVQAEAETEKQQPKQKPKPWRWNWHWGRGRDWDRSWSRSWNWSWNRKWNWNRNWSRNRSWKCGSHTHRETEREPTNLLPIHVRKSQNRLPSAVKYSYSEQLQTTLLQMKRRRNQKRQKDISWGEERPPISLSLSLPTCCCCRWLNNTRKKKKKKQLPWQEETAKRLAEMLRCA